MNYFAKLSLTLIINSSNTSLTIPPIKNIDKAKIDDIRFLTYR